MKTFDRIRNELEKHLNLGDKMLFDISSKSYYGWKKQKSVPPENLHEKVEDFISNYQAWYNVAYSTINQLLPFRLSEFKALYEPDPKRKVISKDNYSIKDFMDGIELDIFDIGLGSEEVELEKVYLLFQSQLNILKSCLVRLQSALFEIRQLAQADILDSELEEARALLRSGFNRASGAICGVILEKHFSEVLKKYDLTISKKNPTINDFNEALKNAEAIDIPMWRRIQLLADIRNHACHGKGKEPTKDDIEELISGTEKVIKTVF